MIPCHYQCPIHTSAFPRAKLLLFVNLIRWSGIPFPFTYKLVKNRLETALLMSEKWKKNPTSLSLKCNIWVKWAESYEHLQSPHLLQERENPKVHRSGSYKRNQICSDLHKNCWEHFSIWYCAKILLFTMMVKCVQCHRNCYAESTKPPGISHRIAGSTQIMANWESALSSSLVTWILQLPLTRSIWRPEIVFILSSTDLCQ